MNSGLHHTLACTATGEAFVWGKVRAAQFQKLNCSIRNFFFLFAQWQRIKNK